MPDGTRDYQQREMRLLSEFVAREYPKDRVLINQRLGLIRSDVDVKGLTPAEFRLLGVFRRYADAIVIKPDRLILIEAEIRPSPGVVSQLELYERLIPTTPELEDQQGKRIVKMLLWAIPDPVLEQLARERGVVARVYHPDWIDEYLASVAPRKRRAERTGLSYATI